MSEIAKTHDQQRRQAQLITAGYIAPLLQGLIALTDEGDDDFRELEDLCNAFDAWHQSITPKPKALTYLNNDAGAEAWRKGAVPNTPPGYQQPGHIFPPLS